MQVRPLALTVGAALVAALGVYLFLDVRATSSTSPELPDLIEEARLRHQRSTQGTNDTHVEPPPSAPLPAADSVFAKGNDPKPRPPVFGGDEIPAVPPRPRARGDHFRRGDMPTPPSDGVEAPELDAALAEANKAYDRKDFEGARTLALKLLQQNPPVSSLQPGQPGHTRMLRVVVSSSCILGDTELAGKYAAALPPHDRQQIASRCAQYGITLP